VLEGDEGDPDLLFRLCVRVTPWLDVLWEFIEFLVVDNDEVHDGEETVVVEGDLSRLVETKALKSGTEGDGCHGGSAVLFSIISRREKYEKNEEK
jgi:hypothetical protein